MLFMNANGTVKSEPAYYPQSKRRPHAGRIRTCLAAPWRRWEILTATASSILPLARRGMTQAEVIAARCTYCS